jgi:hypothetical protein
MWRKMYAALDEDYQLYLIIHSVGGFMYRRKVWAISDPHRKRKKIIIGVGNASGITHRHPDLEKHHIGGSHIYILGENGQPHKFTHRIVFMWHFDKGTFKEREKF